MMNYDSPYVAHPSDENLKLIQEPLTPSYNGAATTSTAATAEECCSLDVSVEEAEQPAMIQTVELPPSLVTNDSEIEIVGARIPISGVERLEISTPQRKMSASSRLMNAFQQFYSSGTGSMAENDDIDAGNIPLLTAQGNRTPSKGMESKLLSMWHNVKYGWSGKIKPNFSKEQPVWLLGRCYHRKSTPPSSMETSVELNPSTIIASGGEMCTRDISKTPCLATNTCKTINQLALSSGPASCLSRNLQHVDEIVVPQELGMDAVENQVAEHSWEEGIEGFRRDFYSRIWLTYRREFPTMNGSNYTSDCGWGCMLRSGQMLLAQGLICHFLSRSWRYDPDTQLHSTYEDNMHKKIIKWFGDSSSKSSPFSIHALVNLGEKMGKKPGDWYGPASVSHLLRLALKTAANENADFDNIVVYVAKECTIYIKDIEDECRIPEPSPKKHVPWQTSRKPETPKSKQQKWKSLIVLVPLRLGTQKLNPIYAHCLKLLLSTEYCIGIIGGRPKHSLFFVGFQDMFSYSYCGNLKPNNAKDAFNVFAEDKLIHLDPHYCQEMVDVNQENFLLHSFHCKSPRKLKIIKMDPSCCIGFYCQTKSDFNNFMESVQLYLHPMRCGSSNIDKVASPPPLNCADGNTSSQFAEINYPLFTFCNGRCIEREQDCMSDLLYKTEQSQVSRTKQVLGCQTNLSGSAVIDDDDGETEEFVLL